MARQNLQFLQLTCLLGSRRFWIWAGICYNLCFMLVLTALVGVSLTYLSPPKARPTTPEDEVAMRNKVHQEAVKRSRTTRRLKVTYSPLPQNPSPCLHAYPGAHQRRPPHCPQQP